MNRADLTSSFKAHTASPPGSTSRRNFSFSLYAYQAYMYRSLHVVALVEKIQVYSSVLFVSGA